MNQIKNVMSKTVHATDSIIQKIRKTQHKPSVFGKAPSLSQMRLINETTKDKKIQFRGAMFWYYYRVYYPYVFPLIFIVFMIVTLTKYNTIEGQLIFGASLSLLGGLSVIGSYIMIIPWRKHPSVLVLYRSLTNMIFSINILLEAFTTNLNPTNCRNYAVITHFTLLASESWLTTIASDLVYSLTNPFASYKANLKRYHVLVWLFSFIISFILYFDTKCQGMFDNSVCWVNLSSTNSPCLWGYYLFWIVCMYAYQIYSFIFAYLRLKRGLPVTFEIRKKCAEETFKCLASYAVYLSLLVFFFSVISSDPSPKEGSSMANFSLFFLYVVANRGSIDSVIWFMLHDFIRDDSDTLDILLKKIREERKNQKLVVNSKVIKDNVRKTFTELADLAIEEFDESDLSPQVNMALRQQIVSYVTTGIKESLLYETRITDQTTNPPVAMISTTTNYHSTTVDDNNIHLDNYMIRLLNIKSKDKSITSNLKYIKLLIKDENNLVYPFKSFGYNIFRKIRRLENINDDEYIEEILKPSKERLSEGASGAFMFFCGNHNQYIVKTIKLYEAKNLHSFLVKYYRYIKDNKNSLLCRFLGSYSIRIYEQTFYFVVMLNCFHPLSSIQERYDIKGSWVGRSADVISKKSKKRTVCRHCNSYYLPVENQQCTKIVGNHEPNIVLKDNDLRVKISLNVANAINIVDILKKDSQLLGEVGVLDYSLLAGVKKMKFDVNISNEDAGAPFYIENPQANEREFSAFKATSVTGINETLRCPLYLIVSLSGPAVYHFGIVDFLQHWSTKKKIERYFKIYVLRKDPEGLSVMEPTSYMLRFQNKMDQIFDLEEITNNNSKSYYENEVAHTIDDATISNSNAINRSTNGYEYVEVVNPLVLDELTDRNNNPAISHVIDIDRTNQLDSELSTSYDQTDDYIKL